MLKGKILAEQCRTLLHLSFSRRSPPLPVFNKTKNFLSDEDDKDLEWVSREELLGYLPDPKPAVEAFTTSYHYFRKV